MSKMKLNTMLYDLLDLAKQENEPNRYTHSEEYDKLFNELDNKTLIIDELEEQVGCPLEVREQALKQCEFEGLYFETEDTDGFKRVGVYKCCLRYDAFNNKFYWNCGWNAETWLNCYQKTWWLRKDKRQ